MANGELPPLVPPDPMQSILDMYSRAGGGLQPGAAAPSGYTPSAAQSRVAAADHEADLLDMYARAGGGAAPPAQQPRLMNQALPPASERPLGWWGDVIRGASEFTQRPRMQQIAAGMDAGVGSVMQTIGRRLPFVSDEAIARGDEAVRQLSQEASRDASIWRPQTWGGPLAKAAGQAAFTTPLLGAAGTAIGAGGAQVAPQLAQKLAQPATRLGSIGAHALQGAGYGAGTSALTGGSWRDVGISAGLGGLLGGVIGGVTHRADKLAGMRGGMSVPDAELAQRAEQLGIPVDVGKFSRNPTTGIFEGQARNLPGGGGPAFDELGRQAWYKNVARLMGETNADELTPRVMASANNRIGPGIDAIANRTTVNLTPDVRQSLQDIATDARMATIGPENFQRVRKGLELVAKEFGNAGRMSGQTYRTLVQTNGPLRGLSEHAEPAVADFGHRLKQTLHDAFMASAPAETPALQELLGQYRVMKTVEPLVSDAVARGNVGHISPGALASKVIQASRRYDPGSGGLAYTGGDELAELAAIGSRFFGGLPESGTAPRAAAMAMPYALQQIATKNPASAAYSMGVLKGNQLLQQYLRSPELRRNLVNTSLDRALIPLTGRNIGRTVPSLVGLLGPQPQPERV